MLKMTKEQHQTHIAGGKTYPHPATSGDIQKHPAIPSNTRQQPLTPAAGDSPTGRALSPSSPKGIQGSPRPEPWATEYRRMSRGPGSHGPLQCICIGRESHISVGVSHRCDLCHHQTATICNKLQETGGSNLSPWCCLQSLPEGPAARRTARRRGPWPGQTRHRHPECSSRVKCEDV